MTHFFLLLKLQILQAYFILDEFILAGEIQETSKKCVLNAIKLQVIKMLVGMMRRRF